MFVYSLISPWVQQTSQFTPLVLELSLIQSRLLWGEFSVCPLCCSYSQSVQISFLVPPGTHHCWVNRGGMIREACPTPVHMADSVTRAPVTHPSTNRARCCLTSVIWRKLVTTLPCATMFCSGLPTGIKLNTQLPLRNTRKYNSNPFLPLKILHHSVLTWIVQSWGSWADGTALLGYSGVEFLSVTACRQCCSSVGYRRICFGCSSVCELRPQPEPASLQSRV